LRSIASASPIAAAAEAAHDVLVTYFPGQKGWLDSALTVTLAAANDGDIAAGKKNGAAAATDILSLRINHGATPDSNYANPPSAGI